MTTLALLFAIGASILLSFNSSAQIANPLPRSTPEAQGVSSSGILDFLNAVDTAQFVEVHSIMIIRHGKVISEGWWNPYGPQYKHMMASVSKTFTATAIGLAASENKLKINDKVISFFPYSLPDTISNEIKALTVKDLLTMSVGQEPAPTFRGTDWITTFLSARPVYQPGSTFLYNNMASFILSAIVQQTTGQTVFDYLTPRLFEPLGIKGIDWDLSPQGINLGAAGLRLHTEDMAKFGQLLLQNGTWNGKQLIPSSWVKEATSFKIESKDPGNKRPKELNDWAQGYCYQMWRGRHNTVRFDGARGQWGILIPDKDAVVILTSNSTVSQRELDLVWKFLLPAMKDTPSLPVDKTVSDKLAQKFASLKLNVTETGAAHAKLEAAISDKEFQLHPNPANINAIAFSFTNNGMSKLMIKKNDVVSSIKIGTDSWVMSNTNITSILPPPPSTSVTSMSKSKSTTANYMLSPVYKVGATYVWLSDNTLQVTARFVEDNMGAETILFKFNDDQGAISVSVQRKGTLPAGQPSAPLLTGKLVSRQ